MFFLQFANLNPQLVKIIERDHELQNKELDEIYQTIFSRMYDFSDGYTYYLQKNKLAEGKIVYLNVSAINKLLGIENMNLQQKCEYYINAYKPTVIFDQAHALKGYVNDVKHKFKWVKHIAVWDGYIKTKMYFENPGYDSYFTCVKSIKEDYTNQGLKCYLNPFGFDARILGKLSSPQNKINLISFAGSLISQVHQERIALIKQLINRKQIHLFIGNMGIGAGITKSKLREIAYGNLTKIRDIVQLEKNNKGGKYGLDMYAVLQQYTCTLNIHGDQVAEVGNMRTTEAGGMSTCQLIDYKPNAADYYEPDYEAVYFKNEAELIDKSTYLLNNPKEAEKIGAAAQLRTLKEHTLEQHVLRFWEYIKI